LREIESAEGALTCTQREVADICAAGIDWLDVAVPQYVDVHEQAIEERVDAAITCSVPISTLRLTRGARDLAAPSAPV